MAYDRYGVVKIRGSDPEIFWIVFADTTSPKGQMFFSDDFDEQGLRAELTKRGFEAAKIDELIATARANPK